MKLLNKFLILLFTLCLTLGMTGNIVNAEEENQPAAGYKYKIVLRSGNMGTFDGASSVIISDQLYNTSIDLGNYLGSIGNLMEEKDEEGNVIKAYFVRGFKEAGRDELSPNGITVTKDNEYVVAYGIAGNLVEFTVRYVERGTDRELAPSAKYQGNVGEKPIVAHQYISGYQPQAYNITKTLSENAEENVLTFEYTRVGGGQSGGGSRTEYIDRQSTSNDNGGETIYVDGGVNYIDGGTNYVDGGINYIDGPTTYVPGVTTVIEGNGGGAGAGAGVAVDGTDAGTGAEAGAGGNGQGLEPIQAPQQLLDLDAPLANVDLEKNSLIPSDKLKMNLAVIGLILGAVAIAILLLYLSYKKKEKEAEETENNIEE